MLDPFIDLFVVQWLVVHLSYQRDRIQKQLNPERRVGEPETPSAVPRPTASDVGVNGHCRGADDRNRNVGNCPGSRKQWLFGVISQEGVGIYGHCYRPLGDSDERARATAEGLN